MSQRLVGKVALVTGTVSKRGIGCAIALRLALDGADVAVVDIYRTHPRSSEGDRAEGWKGLDSLVEEIQALGQQGLAIVADVTQRQQVKEMVEKTLDRFGKIDILVNSAAIAGPFRVPTLEVDEEAWRKVLSVNLIGPFLCSKVVAREMMGRGPGGKIINIASRAGKIGAPGFAAYAASKAGLINLTQTLALEMAPHGVNVNAVCPGSVATEMQVDRPVANEARRLGVSIEEATAQVYSDLVSAIPLGRVGQSEDIANAVAFLASEEADHITGIALNVTGGGLMAP